MHGIHHSTVRSETDSNWSSGLSLWDHLHRTFRGDVALDGIQVGVPGYRDPAEIRLRPTLAMPFMRQRDAWRWQSGRGLGEACSAEPAGGAGPHQAEACGLIPTLGN
jgi:hypothetical protein